MIAEENGENGRITKFDGLDEAIVGYVQGPGMRTKFVYDPRLIIDILMDRDGMSEEDATEWFHFNIECAYVGEDTPAFIRPIPVVDES